MRHHRYNCFHFRVIWLPVLYAFLFTFPIYGDSLLVNQDFDDSDDLAGRRWSFYRQHRYDIKKPGPTYFVHEPDSNEVQVEDVQLSPDLGKRPVYTEGVVQWLPIDETDEENAEMNNEALASLLNEASSLHEFEPPVSSDIGDDGGSDAPLSDSKPLLTLLEGLAKLISDRTENRDNGDEPVLMETLDQDDRREKDKEDDQDNYPILSSYKPNRNSYQDNRFELLESLPSYVLHKPDINDYLSMHGLAMPPELNQRPIFSEKPVQWAPIFEQEEINQANDQNAEQQEPTVNLDEDETKQYNPLKAQTDKKNVKQRIDESLRGEPEEGAPNPGDDVDKDIPLSSIQQGPTKLIIPKQLNLLLDSPDSMVKRRFIKTGTDDFPVEPSSPQSLTILTISICLGVFASLCAGLVIFVVKRNQNLRNKLRNLIGNLGNAEEGIEAASDYEDLCRQRMSSKNRKKSDKSEEKLIGTKVKSQGNSGNNGSGTKSGGVDNKSIDSGPEPSPPSRSSTSSWSEEPITSNLDISTGHMILSYMEDHLKNKDRLAKEWEALCAYEVDPCSTTAAMLPQNASKNRFADILPFDHSRVILNDLANSSRSDYINASTITDHDPRSPVYIVTQGPLPSTVPDFWQMVWEQGSVIIVMLTRLMENGLASSARYWPEEGAALYGNFEIHLVSEHIWCDDYLVRSFFLKNIKTNETRTVTQFHYLSWPENGVPPNPRSLLEFRRKVNKSYRGRSCPIVVHCSDGIGRTGTYCLIDMVLNRLAKGAKEIDIAATLEHIRDQRGGSVKSKAQFEFVLEAIAEEVSAILKTLKPN